MYEWHHPGTTKTQGLKNPSHVTATNIFTHGAQGVTVRHPALSKSECTLLQATSAVLYVTYK